MYYPKCKPGFHNFGCCICSPDCPENYTDIGLFCLKPSGNSEENSTGINDKAYYVHFGLSCLDEKN